MGATVNGLISCVEVDLMLGLSVESSVSVLVLGVSFISTVGLSIGTVVRLITVDEQPAKRQIRGKKAYNLCFIKFALFKNII